jgi:nucleoside-diphosphate-sugar epimerase
MKYLVLGSSGQIGSELTKFLRKNEETVIEFDIALDKNQDLRIPNVLDKIIMDVDFVFFLAFDVGGSRYLQKYQYTYDFIENNTKLTLNTFESIKKYKKPYIFASSQMANMSYSPYGICKSLGEIFSDSIGGLTVKFWNVYGLETDHEKSHVITDFIAKAIGGNITMLTDGTEERQFLHAEDCSNCLYILSKEYDKIGRTKNLHVTSFEWTSIREIAGIIQKFLPCEIKSTNNKDTVQLNKKNEPDNYILNFWNPKISLEDGIHKIIKQMVN